MRRQGPYDLFEDNTGEQVSVRFQKRKRAAVAVLDFDLKDLHLNRFYVIKVGAMSGGFLVPV